VRPAGARATPSLQTTAVRGTMERIRPSAHGRAAATGNGAMSTNWKFFQAFVRSPRVVASLLPSSVFLERRLVQAAGLANAAVAVELGSGTGGTTRALLSALPAHAHLVAIERMAEFAEAVTVIDDPRLSVVNGCASSIVAELESRALGEADAVVSGIPFSTLPPALAEEIMRQIHRALRPGGRFVAYQLSEKVAEYARPVFGPPHVEHELLNVPPLRVFTWRKAATHAAAADAV
jgi:phosphatidylethanolamine/phosphatidyl-N-methylethanolamine N-methyltransferase